MELSDKMKEGLEEIRVYGERVRRLEIIADLVRELANSKIELGDITSPVGRAVALEHMFYQMRQMARDAIKDLDGGGE